MIVCRVVLCEYVFISRTHRLSLIQRCINIINIENKIHVWFQILELWEHTYIDIMHECQPVLVHITHILQPELQLANYPQPNLAQLRRGFKEELPINKHNRQKI